MKLVGTNVTVIVVPGAGHWLMEERPKETMDAIMSFF
jgi:pimeloyl-ACP methyl ester carboxylesterase